MSLSKVKIGEQTTVTSQNNVLTIDRWFKAQGWNMDKDYYYLGFKKSGAEVFSFPDKNKAMLFKLTFGGE